ncbi:unnamed protein product [Urochloa humidicola]
MALSTSPTFKNRSWYADLFTDDRVKSLSHQVSTLRDKVWELERKNTQMDSDKGKVEKQLEETKKAAELLASEKKEVEMSMKGENDKLRMEVLAAVENYSRSVEEIKKLKMELATLEEVKEAAAKAFDSEKAAMMMESKDLKRRIGQIQASKDLVDGENNKLRLEVMTLEQKCSLSKAEVERLKMELDTLEVAKEAAANAFDEEKVEINKLLEDQKMKVEEIQASKDLVMVLNNKLRLEALAAEEKHSLYEAEIERLKMELSILEEAKEATVKAFDAEKVEIMKELEDLKKRVEEIQASKDLVMDENDRLRLEVLTVEQKHKMSEAEVERLKIELSSREEAAEVAIKAFDAEKAQIIKEMEDLKSKLEEIQASKDLVIDENNKLRSEVLTAEQKHSLFEAEIERLRKELDALVEAKEVAAKAFDVEKVEVTNELEDLKRKMEEIQTSKDLVKDENDKLRYDVLTAEQKISHSQEEVERLKMELSVLAEAKEAVVKVFDAEKAEFMKETEDLKRRVEESQASKEAEDALCDKISQADKLRDELEELHVSMSQLQASSAELDAKYWCLNDEKNSVQKALDAEKAEAAIMKSKIEALQNNNAEKDAEIGKLKAAMEEKMGQIDVLSKDIELLHQTMAEEKSKKKCSIRANLSSARTCMSSCIPK